jgi:hypothetical protein
MSHSLSDRACPRCSDHRPILVNGQASGLLFALATLLVPPGVSGETSTPGDAAFEILNSADVRLSEGNVRLRRISGTRETALALTNANICADYAPAPADIVSSPRTRRETRWGGQFTGRWNTAGTVSGLAALGGYRGFTDYRSIWLDEYYRQLFSVVPEYRAIEPWGANASAGARWAYVPGSAFAQGILAWQHDRVSPGYEPQVFAPLRRGRDRLETFALKLSTENILSPTWRTLFEASVVDTTGRRPRYALQASVNWAASDAWTLRTVLSGVTEQPAFRAWSGALTLERDWAARWFAGLTLRAYRDTGEVVDPLIPSSAASALRTIHTAASLRWQGDRAAFRLEAGPYRSRYAALPPASAQFARLYRQRDWLRVTLAADWRP